MKKFLLTAAAVVLSAGLAFANGGQQGAAPSSASGAAKAAPAKQEITVGIALTGLQSNSIFIDMRRDMEAKCTAAGYRLIEQDLQNGAPDMVKFLENCLTAHAKVIVIQNIAEDAYRDLLVQLKNQGAVIGSYDNPSKVSMFVRMASNYELGKTIGKMCGEWVHKTPGSKKVAMADYSKIDFFLDRQKGMKDGFKAACPEGKIVFEQDLLLSDLGVSLGEALISSHPDIEGVMCVVDTACIGISDAFDTAGWTPKTHNVGLFGSDASKEGVDAIKKNKFVKGTVDMNLVKQVNTLYTDCLNAYLTGKLPAKQQVVYFPMKEITLANIDQVGKW
jgi:ABC-type sugar transport system substrate-binding protein